MDGVPTHENGVFGAVSKENAAGMRKFMPDIDGVPMLEKGVFGAVVICDIGVMDGSAPQVMDGD
jgi:hypothetical protein